MQFYYSRSLNEDSKPKAARHTSVLQEQFVSVFCSLLDNSDVNHHFPTPARESGYWEATPTHLLSGGRQAIQTAVIKESIQADSFSDHGKALRLIMVGFPSLFFFPFH